LNTINFTHGYLSVQGIEPYTPVQLAVLVRFAKVFDLTYRRFLDIKNAEGQARESQIEASLERIRARALAMHASSELIDVANVLWEQLDLLGHQEFQASAIHLYPDDARTFDAWYALRERNRGRGYWKKGRARFSTQASLFIDEWVAHYQSYKTEYTLEVGGEKLQGWLNEFARVVPEILEGMPQLQYYHFSDFSGGSLVIVSLHPPSHEAQNLQKRIAAVFDLAYRRYVDLQLAELQAYKANVEVALERVRARALAMQHPEELKIVAQALRHEMGLLGAKDLETCSIFLCDLPLDITECWYARVVLEDGVSKLVPDYFSLDLGRTWVGKAVHDFCQSPDDRISIGMTGNHQKEWLEYCESMSPSYRSEDRDGSPRAYHLFRFAQGALGVDSATDLPEESWDLLKRAAAVFSLAYSRFKDLLKAQTDLQQLILEKQRAEEALSELKAAQSQLIHAEKMASLGELTAGIAHEIQNPLNFVNNFSDLSQELLAEMIAEIKVNNAENAMAIADDVVKNLERILHHGKRADVIVKGMLQHSRSGGGTKEPTDINLLADEYLRLAYHGFRAKDKIFAAAMKTDFDEGIGLVDLYQQEVGRVILNLISNACYAVSEKKKLLDAGVFDAVYEPTVTVRTRKINDQLVIKISDNGNGIPGNIRHKIFQPFFTTKPTGQGTGLGLSLSYDIVKTQGGTLAVETREGEGTTFTLSLPLGLGR
jgi:signal transduction histidine kinase